MIFIGWKKGRNSIILHYHYTSKVVFFLQIEPDDEYSKHVCSICIEKIDNWHAFKTMCLNSKETLQACTKKQIEVCDNVEIPPEVPSSQSEDKVTCTTCGKIVLKKSLRLHLTRHTDKFK